MRKILILFLFMVLVVAPKGYAAVPIEERTALIELYNNTNGDNWTASDGWKEGAPGTECTWYGVACDAEEKNVISLDLSDNQLSGVIPPEIGNLSKLWYMNLSDNRLSGTLPPQVGNLSELLKLNLYNNELTGPIPPALGALSKLQDIYLYNNQLSGSIPDELGSLSSLVFLWLNGNQLNGTIPKSIGSLSTLQKLYLYDNHLTGLIPRQLANLTQLKRLRIHKNHFMGPLPLELKNLLNLDEGGSDFRYNGLYTFDEDLRLFLNAKQSGGDWESTQSPVLMLDLNRNNTIDVGDALIVLQVLTGMTPLEALPVPVLGEEVTLGLGVAIYMLQIIADF